MTTNVLPTITTTDQNTGRQITWNVDHVAEFTRNGYTHMIAISRPKGRRSYTIFAELIGDVIVRHTSPLKAF